MGVVKDYLKAVASLKFKKPKGYIYKNFEDFVLKNGREFKPAPSLPAGFTRGDVGFCYMNAFRLVSDHRDALIYCEGYACSERCPIPIPHAWAVNKAGEVIDTTWTDGVEYFGVPMKWSYVETAVLSKKTYGVIGDWKNRFPILREDEKKWSVTQ